MHVVFFGVLIAASMLSLSVHAAEKTIYSSPYVTFAPDGRAWTTNAGDRAIDAIRKVPNENSTKHKFKISIVFIRAALPSFVK